MATYNSASYPEWLDQFAIPVDDGTIPRSKLGLGLGCWIDPSVPNWSLTANSATQRVCSLMIMNASVVEIDMFRLQDLTHQHGRSLGGYQSSPNSWVAAGASLHHCPPPHHYLLIDQHLDGQLAIRVTAIKLLAAAQCCKIQSTRQGALTPPT
jgi:hypothetical protein